MYCKYCCCAILGGGPCVPCLRARPVEYRGIYGKWPPGYVPAAPLENRP